MITKSLQLNNQSSQQFASETSRFQSHICSF